MPRRQPRLEQERRVTHDPALERELSRLWAEPPTPAEVSLTGTPRPRSELDDRVDKWLRDFLGQESACL